MKIKYLVALCIATASLSGCGTMIAKMAIASYPTSTSTYNVLNITEGDVDDYYDLLAKNNGQIVSDEKGRYFYKKEKDGVFSRFALLNQDGAFLKSSLSSSVGLMEPLYSYDNNATLQVDWQETKRRYRFFTQKVGLKLLPLSTTRLYHNLIVKSAKNRRSHLTNPAFVTKAAFSGEMGLYNPGFYNEVLSGILKNATYLISNGNIELFYQIGGHVTRSRSKGVLDYKPATKRMNNFYNLAINFIPVSYFKNLQDGGSYRFYSGCQVNSKKAEIDSVNFNNETTAIPFYSGIAMAIKDKNNNQISLAKNDFYQALRKVKSNRLLVERACKVGFKAMGLSGIIESRKLR